MRTVLAAVSGWALTGRRRGLGITGWLVLRRSATRPKLGPMERQIVGLGGAGGSEEETRRLLAHVVGLAGKPSPKVCAVPTAAGDEADSVLRLYGLLPENVQTSYLPFFP